MKNSYFASFLATSAACLLSANAATTLITASEDTETRQDASTTNYSTLGTVSYGAPGGGQARSMLFRFDTSAFVGDTSMITSIRLRLTLESVTGEREGGVGVVADGNKDWTNTGATWDTRNGSDAWIGNGGARTATDVSGGFDDLLLVTGAEAQGTVFELELTPGSITDTSLDTYAELMTAWSSAATNNGIRIYNSGSGNSGVQQFYSSEDALASNRPTLVVETVPEPSSALLAILGGVFGLVRRRR